MTLILMMIATACASVAIAVAPPPPAPEAEPTTPAPIEITWDYPYTGTMSEHDWNQAFEITSYPDWLRPRTRRVAWCESRDQPTATNWRGPYIGLLQIGDVWPRHYGVDRDTLTDPVVNIALGLQIVNYDLDHGYDAFVQWECQ